MSLTTPLATASFLAAAALARAAGAPPFPHSVHVVDNELECTACHEPRAEGLPVLTTAGCTDCHEEGAPAYASARPRKMWIEFPHARHAESTPCKDCHPEVLLPAWKPGQPVSTYGGCVTCHTESGVEIAPGACAACHGVDARSARPPDHGVGWPTRHGLAAAGRVFEEHGKDCRSCHATDVCIRCHQLVRPTSHTGLWRVRMHGVVAGWDRERCKACHETGVCIRCHTTERPLNHNANWLSFHGLVAGSTTNEHCLACHRPVQCARCHALP